MNQLEIYTPYRAQLAEFKAENKKLVFDYESKKGNREARSHVAVLRKGKAAIETARKDAKQESLDTGRQIDAEAKAITVEIESMIAVHKTALDEIEQREADRIKSIQACIREIEWAATFENLTIDEMRKNLDMVKSSAIDTTFAEFTNEAEKTKNAAIVTLENRIVEAEKRQAEQAELLQLRREKSEREQKDIKQRQIFANAEKVERERKDKEIERQRIEDETRQRAKDQRITDARRQIADSSINALRDAIGGATNDVVKLDLDSAVIILEMIE